jgi:hypothetical protein
MQSVTCEGHINKESAWFETPEIHVAYGQEASLQFRDHERQAWRIVLRPQRVPLAPRMAP